MEREAYTHDLLVGPLEEMTATVPQALLTFVRERFVDCSLSQFVTRALFEEALRMLRLEFVQDVESASGPLDEDRVEAIRRMLRS